MLKDKFLLIYLQELYTKNKNYILRTIMDKPKVINIGFQPKSISQTNTRCSQLQDKDEQTSTIQTFMISNSSSRITNELLTLIKSPPTSIQDLLTRYSNKHTPNMSPKQTSTNKQNVTGYQLEKSIFVKNEEQNQQPSIMTPSINEEISKSNTIYINQQQTDPIEDQNICEKEQRKNFGCVFKQSQKNTEDHILTKQSNVQKTQNKNLNGNSQNINQSQNKTKSDQLFYLIPSKYQSQLDFLLTHFLNFKLYNKTNQSNYGFSAITKRPKTTCKKVINFTSPQRKTRTATSQNRLINVKNTSTSPTNLTEDFNQHLQKIILMEKQIQKKSKKITFLESQLLSTTQKLTRKNNQIRQILQRQACLKKKFTYELEKIMKGKVMSDINDIFLSNLNEKNNYGKSIFEINGKKYIKSNDMSYFSQSTFKKTPKISVFQRSKQSYSHLQCMENIQGEGLKKSQSSSLLRKSKGVNKKQQGVRMAKSIQCLKQEVGRLEEQKSQLFDRLAENNTRIQKQIEKIQRQISAKKYQISRMSEQVQKNKQN